jgi:Tfp pilus assembly protein PilV
MQRLKNEYGATLVEILIAVLLLSVVLVPLAGTFLLGATNTKELSQRMIALGLARREMEYFFAGADLESKTEVLQTGYTVDTKITYRNSEGIITIVVDVAWGQGEAKGNIQLTGLRKW